MAELLRSVSGKSPPKQFWPGTCEATDIGKPRLSCHAVVPLGPVVQGMGPLWIGIVPMHPVVPQIGTLKAVSEIWDPFRIPELFSWCGSQCRLP